MVKEVKNLTNIRLTESDTDGIWLHFETAQGLSAGVVLSSLLRCGDVVNRALEAWAREQLDKCGSWEEIKKELGRLALAIKGATKEEFPADLANLEDYVCKQMQLDKHEPLPSAPANEFLKEGNEERTDVPGTRAGMGLPLQ